MKWIVYSLFLVILILWGLAISVPPEPVAPDHAHRLPRVARLQLASELPATSAEKKGATPAAPAAGATSAAAVGDAQPKSVVTSLPRSSGEEIGADEAGPQAASAPQPSSGPKEQAASGGPGKTPGPAKAAPAAVCMLVANIATEDRAKSLVAALDKVGAEGVIGSRQEPLPPLNWVLTRTYGSRHDALRALRNFQRQGIDSFLITEGQWANAISLGIYHSGAAAHKVVRRLAARGVDARIEPYERTQQVFFAKFPALTPDQVTALHRQVKPSSDQSGEEQIIGCQGVASTGKST